jgi:cytoskeleton-associated protein 5
VKELKEAFEAMEKEGKGKGSVKPERFTRAQARELENAAQEDDTPDAVDREAPTGWWLTLRINVIGLRLLC